MALIEKIVSGGQTGADRAALDFALEHGIPHGGWCPEGRLAEDGCIAAHYLLKETPDSDYSQRTEWNVRDSDGTVVFSVAPVLSGGSKKTLSFAHKHLKPLTHISRDQGAATPDELLLRFMWENNIKVINVAGPRASEEPEVYPFVRAVLQKALGVPLATFRILKERFEGREAIYLEKSALRVRVSNVHLHGPERRITADVEEIPTPGLGVGWFPSNGVTPRKWGIGAGYLTDFSERHWAAGYGMWVLFFDPETVRKVSQIAARWPEGMASRDRYKSVLDILWDDLLPCSSEHVFDKPDSESRARE